MSDPKSRTSGSKRAGRIQPKGRAGGTAARRWRWRRQRRRIRQGVDHQRPAVRARERDRTASSHDRPLKGIEVKVSARDVSVAPWSDWGTVRTDADGDFTLRETNNGKSRFLRVRARLVGDDLEVNESKLDDLASFDLLDTNWRTVWESNGQLEGPAVSIGTRVFAAGGALGPRQRDLPPAGADLVRAAHRDRSPRSRGLRGSR